MFKDWLSRMEGSGACDLKQNNDHDAALDHYRMSLDFADEIVDRFFALSGLLKCLSAKNQNDDVDRYGNQMFQLARFGLDGPTGTEVAEEMKLHISGICED